MEERREPTGGKMLKVNTVWKKKKENEGESRMLIGKIMAGKSINKRAVLATMRKGWNLGEETEIVEMNDDTFVFTFKDLREKHRLLKGRPWSVQGSLMNIQEWSEFMVTSEASFEKTPVWAQFHNLPLGMLEEEINIQNMANLIGELVWYEKPTLNDKFNRSFGRVRVLVDINKPLITGFWATRPDDSEVWVKVKYERVQSFCYKCGVIGHDFKSCKNSATVDEKGDRIYGPWTITNAERDIEDAMVKFSPTWNEEDCRQVKTARGDKSQQAREEEELSMGRDSWPTVKVAAVACTGLTSVMGMQQEKKEGKSTCEKVSHVNALTPSTKGKKCVGLELFEADPQAQVRVNPILDGLKINQYLSRGEAKDKHEEKAMTNKEAHTAKSETLKEPPILLSPISDMSKKLNDVSLKRQAAEPLSPGPNKKRRLFDEKGSPKNKIRPEKAPGRKRNIRSVKKELRARLVVDEVAGSHNIPGEIDFPTEWLITKPTEGSRQDDGEQAEGSGGCPTTASKEI